MSSASSSSVSSSSSSSSSVVNPLPPLTLPMKLPKHKLTTPPPKTNSRMLYDDQPIIIEPVALDKRNPFLDSVLYPRIHLPRRVQLASTPSLTSLTNATRLGIIGYRPLAVEQDILENLCR